MVFILGPSVQNMGISQELDIADLEDHVQGETLAGLFEDVCCGELGGGELGDEAGGGEAGEGADEVGVPSVGGCEGGLG